MAESKEDIINIINREEDYKTIRSLVWNAETGVRAIWLLYDDHSTDKNSKDNVLILKENIHYRLFATTHQYLLLIRELNIAEQQLHKMHMKDPKMFNAFPLGNPHFDAIEVEISSIFDNLIFQISSVFDYLSHMICYICRTNKSKTLYWTKLAKLCRDSNSDFNGDLVREVIDNEDRNFVGKLYDYRSRLLHNKRDKHHFTTSVGFSDKKAFDFDIKILASKTSQKHFKVIKETIGTKSPTLLYMSSYLIKKTFQVIENTLTEVQTELVSNSNFFGNLQKPKNKGGFMMIIADPKSRTPKPVSNVIWNEYIEGRKANRI